MITDFGDQLPAGWLFLFPQELNAFGQFKRILSRVMICAKTS
jgi:hypothetical protein